MNIKKTSFFAPLALLMIGSWSTSMAAAGGTCSAPLTISSGTTINNLNNCATPTGDGDTSIATVCGSNNITGGFHVFTWHYGGVNTPSGNLTVTPTAPYNPAIFVGDGADCTTAASGFCDAQADGPAQTVETIALSGLNTANTTYFLFVASTATGAARCGQYNLGVGTLPVKLQSFSIN
jgi:hypothetical protein